MRSNGATLRVPPGGHAVLAAIFAGLVAARLGLFLARPHQATDFDQLWYAAEALVRGADPYEAIARGAPYPLYYPLPAVLLAVPFSFVSLPLARVLWDVTAGWMLGFSLWRRGGVAPLVLLSGAYIHAMVRGQVAPMLLGAILIPGLAWLLTIKPNEGLALWIAYPNRRAVWQSALAIGVSLLVLPSWPAAMLRAVQVHSEHIMAPVTRPFGWLLLAAVFRWRTGEGRLLLALALVPQNLLPYATLFLGLIPRSIGEMAVFVGGTWLALIVLMAQPVIGPPDLVLLGRAVWPYLLVGVYLPALYMVLRRPNVGGPGSSDLAP